MTIPSHKTKPRVLVVGAGLGGLAVAIATTLTGHFSVTVLESSPVLGEVGAGIQLSPNCSRLLKRWGCEKYLKDNVVTPKYGRAYRWQYGKILSEREINHTTEAKFGAPYWHVHRADLHEALAHRVQELGVPIRLDARVVSVDVGPETGSPKVTIHTGEVLECEFLVGADGLHSKVREAVCPEAGRPVATGDLAYRFTVPVSLMKDNPHLAQLAEIPGASSWWGPDKHVVGYILRNQTTYNVVAVFPDDGSVQGASKAVGTLEQVQELYKGWCKQVTSLMDLTEPNGLSKWILMDLAPLPRWNNSCCALVGGACRPMLPYLAQGSAQAFEDAATLAVCMDTMPNELDKAAEIFTSIRKSRATKVQQFARAQRARNHLKDGVEQEARDAGMMNLPPAQVQRTRGSGMQRVERNQRIGRQGYMVMTPKRPQDRHWLVDYELSCIENPRTVFATHLNT